MILHQIKILFYRCANAIVFLMLYLVVVVCCIWWLRYLIIALSFRIQNIPFCIIKKWYVVTFYFLNIHLIFPSERITVPTAAPIFETMFLCLIR